MTMVTGYELCFRKEHKTDLFSSWRAAAAAAAFRFCEALGLRSSESGRLRCIVGSLSAAVGNTEVVVAVLPLDVE